MEKVIISVKGGAVIDVEKPSNITVEIKDYDTDGCDTYGYDEGGEYNLMVFE